MDSKETISQLIERIKKATGLTQEQIAERIGYERPYLSQAKKSNSPKLRNILSKEFSRELENLTFNKPDQPTYLKQRFAQKNNAQDKYTAPFFPIKAQAGYVRTRDQEMFIDSLERYALPPGLDPHGAIWRYWEVEGRSMEPVFQSGDIILTSQVHQMDWENLRNFYVYVIVTQDVVLIKRIYCKSALEWVLISENESEFDQQILPVEFIKEVWIFRRKIETKAPPTKRFEIKV